MKTPTYYIPYRNNVKSVPLWMQSVGDNSCFSSVVASWGYVNTGFGVDSPYASNSYANGGTYDVAAQARNGIMVMNSVWENSGYTTFSSSDRSFVQATGGNGYTYSTISDLEFEIGAKFVVSVTFTKLVGVSTLPVIYITNSSNVPLSDKYQLCEGENEIVITATSALVSGDFRLKISNAEAGMGIGNYSVTSLELRQYFSGIGEQLSVGNSVSIGDDLFYFDSNNFVNLFSLSNLPNTLDKCKIASNELACTASNINSKLKKLVQNSNVLLNACQNFERNTDMVLKQWYGSDTTTKKLSYQQRFFEVDTINLTTNTADSVNANGCVLSTINPVLTFPTFYPINGTKVLKSACPNGSTNYAFWKSGGVKNEEIEFTGWFKIDTAVTSDIYMSFNVSAYLGSVQIKELDNVPFSGSVKLTKGEDGTYGWKYFRFVVKNVSDAGCDMFINFNTTSAVNVYYDNINIKNVSYWHNEQTFMISKFNNYADADTLDNLFENVVDVKVVPTNSVPDYFIYVVYTDKIEIYDNSYSMKLYHVFLNANKVQSVFNNIKAFDLNGEYIYLIDGNTLYAFNFDVYQKTNVLLSQIDLDYVSGTYSIFYHNGYVYVSNSTTGTIEVFNKTLTKAFDIEVSTTNLVKSITINTETDNIVCAVQDSSGNISIAFYNISSKVLSLSETPINMASEGVVVKLIHDTKFSFLYVTTSKNIYRFLSNGIYNERILKPSYSFNSENFNAICCDDMQNIYTVIGKKLYMYVDYPSLTNNLSIEGVVNMTDVTSKLHDLSLIYLKDEEYIQDWVYNKAFYKIIQNLDIILKAINKKFVYELTDGVISNFYLGDILKDELVDFDYDYNFFVGYNEINASIVINRCIEKIYSQQLALLEMVKPRKKIIFTSGNLPILN